MMHLYVDAFVIIASYLLGSVLFGIAIAKLFHIGNLRDKGSGNVGATNVFRVGGKTLGILTMLLDVGKGYFAVFISSFFVSSDMILSIAGVSVILGHVFPIWHKFRGGKGVATTVGATFAINPHLGFVVVTLWLCVFILTRISSLSSVVSIFGMMLCCTLVPESYVKIYATLVSLLVLWCHRENIKRLLCNQEKSLF